MFLLSDIHQQLSWGGRVGERDDRGVGSGVRAPPTPAGHDVIVRMSHREASPDLAPGAQALTPVVLVHGLGMSGRSMRRLVAKLG